MLLKTYMFERTFTLSFTSRRSVGFEILIPTNLVFVILILSIFELMNRKLSSLLVGYVSALTYVS